MADALDLIHDLLVSNWDSEIYPKGRIFYSHEKKVFDSSRQDPVICYRTLHEPSPKDIQHKFRNTRDVISIEIRTKRSWDHMVLLYAAVLSIIDANRIDPSANFTRLDVLRYNDMNDVKFWRRVVEVSVEAYSKQIT